MATRKASGEVLAALYPVLPELWGGSADLAESDNTAVKGAASFLPADWQTKMWSGGPYGRTLHFGVREHAMGAIMNGIALHSGTRVYGGTFLTFSDYMRGAVRLAALMQLPVTYVWTHDSIGLGEDGPTHQPIEHYAALRAIAGLEFVRPADANETAVAWRTILEHNDRPAGLSLSRQNLAVFDRTEFASAEGVARGGYVLAEASGGTPEVILMGTGSEVQIAVAAREALEADGVPTRVVSLPCWEWFAAQDRAHREQVLPPTVRARVSVEAGVPMGWREFVGDAGRIVGLDHFGASAAYTVPYEQFGSPPTRLSRRGRALPPSRRRRSPCTGRTSNAGAAAPARDRIGRCPARSSSLASAHTEAPSRAKPAAAARPMPEATQTCRPGPFGGSASESRADVSAAAGDEGGGGGGKEGGGRGEGRGGRGGGGRMESGLMPARSRQM